MTLAGMLAAHNDAALEALASKGLVRRARRDLAKGLASIEGRSEETATVVADGQSVAIDARGPVHATCGCPAPGLCRHVLLAMMALRDESGAPTGDAEEAPTAADEVCALSQAAIREFAGADWGKACALAASGEGATLTERGPNLVVEFPGLGVSVTLIAGQGLKGAAYKGPKTRARTIVTAGALLVRQRHGMNVDLAEAGTAPSVELSERFLEQASRTIERGVSAVLPGRSAIGADLFLDLAISTRIEALPRLSAELRGLAKQAKLATTHDVSFEPDVFLKTAARTYALLQALRASPDDLRLRGAVKRDYRSAGGLELWLLGAARWDLDSGARGLTAYAFSPDTGRWYSVSDGRTAGKDPGFEPRTSYRSALWGCGAMDGLMGRALRLPAPRIAADSAISFRLEEAGTLLEARPDVECLLESGAAFRFWPDLLRELGARYSAGLRRPANPLPALVVPTGLEDLRFLDLEQTYEWDLTDPEGTVLTISLPGNRHETVDGLRRMARRIQVLLLEVTLGPHGPRFRPIAVFAKGKRKTQICNLDFDDLPARGPGRSLVGSLADLLARKAKPRPIPADALRAIVSAAMDAVVVTLGHADSGEIDRLATRCEAAGLQTLGAALLALKASSGVEPALKATFLAGEIEAALFFESAAGPA